jgi:hypothetical protein
MSGRPSYLSPNAAALMPYRDGALTHSQQVAAIQALNLNNGDDVTVVVSTVDTQAWIPVDGHVTAIFRDPNDGASIGSIRIRVPDSLAVFSDGRSPTKSHHNGSAVLQIPGLNTYVKSIHKRDMEDVASIEKVVELANRAASKRVAIRQASENAIAAVETAQATVQEQGAVIKQQQHELASVSHSLESSRAASVQVEHSFHIGHQQYNQACQERDALRAQLAQLQAHLDERHHPRLPSPVPTHPGAHPPASFVSSALSAPIAATPAHLFDVADVATWYVVLNPQSVGELINVLRLEFGVTSTASSRVRDAFECLRDLLNTLAYGNAALNSLTLSLLGRHRVALRDAHAAEKFGDAAVAKALEAKLQADRKKNPDSDDAFYAACRASKNPVVRCSKCNRFGHTADKCRIAQPGGAKGGPHQSH